MTFQDFITAECLKADVARIAKRSDGLMSDLPRHFEVRIFAPGSLAPMAIEFSQGSGHNAPPTLADVLECLASDVQGIVSNPSFEMWASEYGYDVDSRKAERAYEATASQADDLRALLGPSAFNMLINCEVS